ncbi:MAG: response regulator [Bryobacterales bacterium]|nr:response regulator [Bryobacterales bacterium]
MPSVDAPLRTRSLPYALPPDALEGLLRLAAHVALTETAVLFLQRGSNYWVLSTSGVSAADAHMAALLLPDVLGPEANDYLCLDATAGTEAAGLLASAMATRPGFLFLHRFVVDGEDCYAILALAHPVAKPLPSEETASLLSEISRQVALRIEARAEKRELEASRERRALRDRFLVAICRENAIGQCLLDSAGKILSLSDGLVQVLEIDRREVEFQPFEQIFAFASAFRDEQTGTAGEAEGAEPVRIPWERVFDTACLFRKHTNELLRLEATAAPARLIDGTDGWCVAISGGEARELSLLPAPRRLQKILIAEDHPVNQRVIQGMVEKLGLSADVVSNGLEAVHAACHGSYAAILMDCQMPDMDGIEATRFIRGTEDRIGRVPIVAVTAFGHEEDRARCFEAGVDEFMVKPIRIEALAQVLAQWAPVAMKPESPASPAAPDPRDHTRRDLEQAINRLSADLDAELVHEVVALFLEDTRVRIDEIRKLSTTVERSQLRNAAHRIKGSCGSLGAVTLMNACERLENLAQNGSREEVEVTIDQVAELFDGIVPLLREFLDASGVRAMDAPPPTDEG